ncbi:hypothetical protein RF11_03360 [Thelohanellus kitauei]|uniref:Uncharacterized protein n=1 Tax=Thelohanellus kitauei TaxID=669202 RepID=A0A0C2N5J5_THEKT|nr:hypothetical protein RF11_03360 [Thelohanellus kitauei]
MYFLVPNVAKSTSTIIPGHSKHTTFKMWKRDLKLAFSAKVDISDIRDRARVKILYRKSHRFLSIEFLERSNSKTINYSLCVDLLEHRDTFHRICNIKCILLDLFETSGICLDVSSDR